LLDRDFPSLSYLIKNPFGGRRLAGLKKNFLISLLIQPIKKKDTTSLDIGQLSRHLSTPHCFLSDAFWGDGLKLPELSKNSRNERHKCPSKSYLGVSFKFLILSLLPSFASGCATVAVSAIGAGAGISVPYVIADCADRTLNFPFEEINKITPQVLRKMDIAIVDDNEIENGKRIKASTKNLDITIDMERVTNRATRITVNAKKGSFVKDKATSEEIINQFEGMLKKNRKSM
jgi:hypothetical protein